MEIPRANKGGGLSVLMGNIDSHGRLVQLPVAQVERNVDQPRLHFDPAAIEALAASIQAQGMIQPVAVRQLGPERFQIIAGERRWLASQRAGITAIPAIVHDVDDRETLVLAMAENLVREDLSPLESAKGYAALIDEWGMTIADLARAVGKSRPAVSNTLRLLELPDPVLDALGARRITEGHGRALLQLEDRRDQVRFAREAIDKGWSVRVLEDAVRSFEKSPLTSTNPRSQAPIEREVELLLEQVETLVPGLRCRAKATGGRGKLELRWEDPEQLAQLLRLLQQTAASALMA